MRLKSNTNLWDIAVRDTHTSGALQFRYNGADVGIGMVLATNGKVGIGTSSPAYKLDVNGTIRATDSISTAGTCGKWISGKTNAAIKFNGLNAINAGSAWYLFNMKSSSGNTIAFGGLGNNIGFYTFLSSQTANIYNSSFLCDTNTGKWSLADLRVTNSLQIGSVTLSYDSANGALKIDGAAYTTGWLSGKGVGSNAAGSGTSTPLLTAWANYTTSMANTYALSAGLGYDLNTRLQNVYTKGTCDGRYGSTLTISGSTLTLKSPDGTSLSNVTLPSSGSGVSSIGVTTSGSGNAVTGISASGTSLTVTKGSTFSLSTHTHSNYGTTLAISGNTLYLRNGSTNLANVTLPTSGGSSVDLSNYVDLSSNQTITGRKTFNGGLWVGTGGSIMCLSTSVTFVKATFGVATGTAPLSVESTTLCSNLNADLLDGIHASGLFTAMSVSGSTLSVTVGGTTKTATLPSGGSTTTVKSLYADSKLCATALSSGGIAVYGSITNGGTATTSNIGNSITSFNAGYFRSVYVNGTAVTSDARLKTIIGDVSLTVEQIAHAPAVNFIWKENGLRSAGSIAQYWRTYLPDTVDVDDMGDKLYLDYSRAALLSAIVTARRVLTVEDKLKLAEVRIDELENKIAQYEQNNEE